MACCAVGGQDLPVVESGTAAQSPSAQTPGQPLTSRNSFVSNRPRSFEQFTRLKRGFGETPAVQTSRLVVITEPSLSRTAPSETLLTAVFIWKCTPRPASFSCA